MVKRLNIILLLLIGICAALWAGDKNIERYIEQYQYIAISEMERTGVPASIKLAQGILESNAGRSTLARKANNHFGIKCGSRWRGRKFYRKDDDYKNGKLIKSCFRVYKNAQSSYIAHSDFLLNNRRYSDLFRLDPDDYKRWARGLKKAGYATSRTYDKKLIRIIQEYRLFKYDAMASSDRVARVENRILEPQTVFFINDAKMTYAKAGETVQAVAQRTGASVRRILKYNEKINTSYQTLETDELVFIQKKRRNFRGKERVHKVRPNEAMYDISQLYGLRLEKLYKKNKMKTGTQPAVGALVQIRGKAKRRPNLRSSEDFTPPPPPVLIETQDPVRPNSKEETQIDVEEREETDFKPTVTDRDKPKVVTPPAEKITEPTAVEERPTPVVTKPQPTIETRRFHIVEAGETLWRISRTYNTTVEELQRLNNLNTKIIKVGMRLRVE
ncbi:MAG: glucosaminidase domain-containing protein [Bacteroidota bacterium]